MLNFDQAEALEKYYKDTTWFPHTDEIQQLVPIINLSGEEIKVISRIQFKCVLIRWYIQKKISINSVLYFC